ncbi:hypothetical protein [Streptomyces sp. UNOC14_S4]|uniref:hypothetical protein n=1 Tax=Streptomyces sp. UNOC14_S4 TaxID=2872340 RepID=UPI001E44103F|nr:hypothetical protein [Streptomyces sp. UNOC14_S4]MCC3771944.1 hypothetical protein [Streptomyces sp. UNOC14_S4]
MAAICSLRSYNRTAPVRLFVDDKPPELDGIAATAGFTVEVRHVPGHSEHIRSRMLKIRAMTEAVPGESGTCLHLDADTLLLDDVADLVEESPVGPGTDADVRMLLRRPKVQTLWTNGRHNFTDTELGRDEIAALIRETFGLALTTAELGAMPCWNSGVVHGTGTALRRIARPWLDRYRHMVTGPTRDRFVPNDQLCLWLTLLAARDAIRTGELPLRWNFMPGRALRLAPGTRDLDAAGLDGVALLHLSVNKDDPWALRRRNAALAAAGVVLPDTLKGTRTGGR